MRTLYLRNVPEDVVERLERLAASESTSVNSIAVKELGAASRRADNALLLGALPDLSIDPGKIVAGLEDERSKR